MEWVTGAAILEHLGNTAPTPSDSSWAEACAAAVNAGIDLKLDGTLVLEPLPAELVLAARIAGAEAYKRREATFGLTGYVDLQGAAIRVARDYLEAVAPLIARYATIGIS